MLFVIIRISDFIWSCHGD